MARIPDQLLGDPRAVAHLVLRRQEYLVDILATDPTGHLSRDPLQRVIAETRLEVLGGAATRYIEGGIGVLEDSLPPNPTA